MKKRHFVFLFGLLIVTLIITIGSFFYVVRISERIDTSFTGQQSSEATVSFFIEGASVDPAPTPTPSPGGGSGGGSSGGATREYLSALELIPKELNVIIVSGEKDDKQVRVINIGDTTLVLDLQIKGIPNIIGLNTNHLVLSVGQEGNVFLSVNAPDPGVYAGKIIFNGGDFEEELKVLVNVKSEKILFDVSVDLPLSDKVIALGDPLRSVITVTQVGNQIETELTANYLIKDFEGNTVYEESENLIVIGSKSFTKDFSTFDLSSGDYVIGVEVVSGGGVASASASFSIEVSKPLLAPPTKDYTLWIMIGLVLLSIVVVILSIIKYKRATKRYKIK